MGRRGVFSESAHRYLSGQVWMSAVRAGRYIVKLEHVVPLRLVPLVTSLFALSSAMEPRPARVGRAPTEQMMSASEKLVPVALSQSLSVVLPAYNEEAVIEKTVTGVIQALQNWTSDFEVVVINDGSQDHTKEILARLTTQDARIRVLNHAENRGYGAALATGFHAVNKDLVFFMDSDGQFDIGDLVRFFPFIEEYDAVFGYRNPRHDPWIRKLNAWGWQQLVWLIFGVRVRDIDCAFKLYKADFFQTLQLETAGAMINAEILYKFKRHGYSYAEVGVRHLPRAEGQATGANPQVIMRALQELFVFARKWKREERRQRAGMPK